MSVVLPRLFVRRIKRRSSLLTGSAHYKFHLIKGIFKPFEYGERVLRTF